MSRQPPRQAWPLERLLHERAIALEHALEQSTAASYSSALNSYLTFCDLHRFQIHPTENNLSLYVVFQSHHIEPRSVDSYLSGICSELEPFYPDIRARRRSPLVSRTLKGCKRLYSKPVRRKRALTRDDLNLVYSTLSASDQHDDSLFLAIILTGFNGLMQLGELVWPDSHRLRTFHKVTRRTSVVVHADDFQFQLHSHKTDKNFAGDTILVKRYTRGADPFTAFTRYLTARDKLFPLRAELWLQANGHIPTRAWFIRKLRHFFPADISGHSMRAGGATALAIEGTPGPTIQAIGCWSSTAWQIYIREHPVVLHAMMFVQQQNTPGLSSF